MYHEPICHRLHLVLSPHTLNRQLHPFHLNGSNTQPGQLFINGMRAEISNIGTLLLDFYPQFLNKLSILFYLHIQDFGIPPEVLELQELSMNIRHRSF